MIEAVAELPFSDDVMPATWVTITLPAVAVNVAFVAPAATITLEGTANAALLLESATEEPPAGAPAESVTVHVDVRPEATVEGVQTRLVIVGKTGVTVTAAEAEPPFNVAVTVAA